MSAGSLDVRLPTTVEPRPARPSWDLTRILLAVVGIGGLLAASLWILRPFLPSVIWATMIVVATWPMFRALERRLWGRRGLAVVVITLVMLAALLVPLAFATIAIVQRADDFVTQAKTLIARPLPPLPERIAHVPVVGKKIAFEWDKIARAPSQELAARVGPHVRDIVRWILGQAGSVGGLLLQLLLTIGIAALMYARGEMAVSGVLAFARRLAGEQGSRAVALSGGAIRAVALGIVVTALVQALVGGIGLFAAGVPHTVLLTCVMLMLGIAQVGPSPVMFGAVIWLFAQDRTTWGIVLIVWSLVTMSLDNVLRPLLIKRGADLPLLLIVAGVVGGLLAFGLVGLFVGPVILAVAYTLLVAWVQDGGADSTSQQENAS
jgi:predicted PurR-regulated permease PerM